MHCPFIHPKFLYVIYVRLYAGFWRLKKALFLNMFDLGLVGAGYIVDPRHTAEEGRPSLLVILVGDADGSQASVSDYLWSHGFIIPAFRRSTLTNISYKARKILRLLAEAMVLTLPGHTESCWTLSRVLLRSSSCQCSEATLGPELTGHDFQQPRNGPCWDQH